MRKNNRIFESGGDQINLYDIFDALQKYWQRFFLVFVVALALSYAYFLKTLPLPHSKISIKVGFNSIKAGRYPDGSIFSQNDFISDSVIKAVFDNISELKNANRWTPSSIKNALLVTPIYPLDLQMAKNQLSNENSKLTQAEIQASYDKLMYFASSEYIISFKPAPAMPLNLQERVLSEIVRQYSDFALRQHLPFSMINADYIGDNLLSQQNYYPAYEYFAKTAKTINELAVKVNSSQDNYESNRQDNNRQDSSRQDSSRQDNRSSNRTDSRSASLNALDTKLKGIRAQLDSVEYFIYDEKSLPDTSFVRKMLEMDISDARVAIETKKKQAEYKVYLASLPISGLPKDRDSEPQDHLKNTIADGGSAKIVDMMLTYTNQYYRMINEADAINSEIADLQVKLSRQLENLKRIDAPYTGKESIENRTKNMVAALEKTNTLIKETIAWQAKEIKESYAKDQPPVMNYFIVQGENAMPLAKVFAVAMGCTFAFMVFQISGYSIKMMADRQKKLADVTPMQSPQINRKG